MEMNPQLAVARALLEIDDKITKLGSQRAAIVNEAHIQLYAKFLIQERPGLRAPDVTRVLGLDRGSVDDVIYALMRNGEVLLAKDSTLSCVNRISTKRYVERHPGELLAMSPDQLRAEYFALAKHHFVETTELLDKVDKLRAVARAFEEVLGAVDYEERRKAICRTCPSNECQIRERCTSGTACRSKYTLAKIALAAEASKIP